MVEADPLDRLDRHPLDRAGRARLLAAGRFDPGLGDGAEVGDEAAGRAVRLAPRPGGRQLGQAGEPEQPLGDLGLGGEEALAAQPDAARSGAARRRRRGAPPSPPRRRSVEAEEGLDPLPRLGLELGAVERRFAAGDHVDACAAGRSSSAAPGRPAAARSAAGSAPAPRRPSRRGRRAPAARRSRRAPRAAGRAPSGRRGGRGCRAPPSPPATAPPCAAGSASSTQIASAAGARRRPGARPRAPPPAPGRARWRSARSAAWARGSGARARSARPRGGGLANQPRRRGFAPLERVELVRVVGGEGFEQRPLGRVDSSSSSTIRYSKRSAICLLTSGRSASRQSRARKTSPRSRLPASARMRSWAV